MKSPTLIEIKTVLEATLKGKYVFALVLGSAATERFHKESDLDIAVYFKDIPDFEKTVSYKNLLEDKLKIDCDLIVLNKFDPIFAIKVIETGR